jgi:hypothetical protein
MTPAYSRLKAELRANNIDLPYLAELLDRSRSYVAMRTSGARAWDLDDMYKIMEIIGWPAEKLHEVFPPRPGVMKEGKKWSRK